MNEEKVTIIVGIYNSGKFLRKGLESLKTQTWTNVEILLMDDGSTDDSGSICDEFAASDKRFIPIHKKNSGVCDSRNKALDLASGDYVCFMDGDDWFSPDFVEYMMNIIHSTHTKIALSDHLFTTRDQVQIIDDRIEVQDCNRVIADIIYMNMVLGPWNKMYSMELINKYNIRFPPHWFGETLHFANTIAYFSKNIGVGHRKVYNYRLNNVDSGTTKYNVETRLLSLDNCLNLRKCIFAKEQNVRDAIEWHIYANYYELLLNIIATNSKSRYMLEYNEAKTYLKKNWFKILIHSKVNLKRKVAIVIEAFFPIMLAQLRMKKHLHAISKDKMM
ncbi:glycosyltransferase family 2 protein [Fibrobacter sp.]|uniref:glycosyltransferase family 2 protein n=1 Tax=Fibrobacter sp. TaxID=35828 RepID=UPI003862EBEA